MSCPPGSGPSPPQPRWLWLWSAFSRAAPRCSFKTLGGVSGTSAPRPALRHPASLPCCHSARPRAHRTPMCAPHTHAHWAHRTHTPTERYNGVWLCRAAAAAAAADVVAERSRFPVGARSGFILGMGQGVGSGGPGVGGGGLGGVMRQIST